MAALDDLLDQLTRGWRGYVLIALIALASALPGVARMPVMDRDEARFTQATRQMLETGDFVRIRVQEDDRNKKPIGIHWLQAASVATAEPITGKLNTIWPYRVPSVLGVILAALATFWAGSALIDRRAAFLGAALFAGGVLLGFEGMTAKTDAMLCGLTTLTLAAMAQLYAGDRRRLAGEQTCNPKLLSLLFWIALGAGVLIKGPVTPLVALLTFLAICTWEKRWAWAKPLAWWPGPIIAALIVLPWMIAIGAATDGAFFREAFGEDLAPKLAGGSEGHFAWPGTHLALLSILIFPATFALPAAVRLATRVIRRPRSEPEPLRFLLAWAIPSFILFELMPTKLAHYTLPTFPALTLLAAAAITIAARERWRWTNLIGIALFAIAGAALVALVSYGVTFMPGDADTDVRRAVQAGLIGGGLFLAALVALTIFARPIVRVGIAVIAALVISYGLRERILPEARTLLVSAEATAALARARLSPTDTRPLWVVGYRETSLVFMTRTDIRLRTPAEAGEHAQIGDAMLIESRFLAETEAELAARGLGFARRIAPVSGHNYGNGQRVDLYPGDIIAATPE